MNFFKGNPDKFQFTVLVANKNYFFKFNVSVKVIRSSSEVTGSAIYNELKFEKHVNKFIL